jgi:hypothetical protein
LSKICGGTPELKGGKLWQAWPSSRIKPSGFVLNDEIEELIIANVLLPLNGQVAGSI